MPRSSPLTGSSRVAMFFPQGKTCQCHDDDPPPWTGEIHGLSQALLSETAPMRAFWWLVLVMCIICGVTTTTLVIVEYVHGPTATSTTIRLTDSLELPALTICPKVPDVFDSERLFTDMRTSLPNITRDVQVDILRYFLAGNGVENMDSIANYNRTHLNRLDSYYKIWSHGYSTADFWDMIQDEYGYKCEDLFYSCQFGGNSVDCCNDLFQKQRVMRRGICYQTRRGVNQTEADDIGRLILSIKAPVSVTSPQYKYVQPQMIVYVTDNFNHVVDFPRFYLYPHEWNRMRFSARFIELIESRDVCTKRIVGKDAECMIRKWLLSNVVIPFNCSLSYLQDIHRLPPNKGVCDPSIITDNYYDSIQLVYNSAEVKEECIPGCHRWDYTTALQQSQSLTPFVDYVFNLEVSFNDLQYEFVKEVYTTTVPGFMSQIGGQFGFFLGLSIITFVQMILYGVHFVFTTVMKKSTDLYRTFSSFTMTQGQDGNRSNSQRHDASIHSEPTQSKGKYMGDAKVHPNEEHILDYKRRPSREVLLRRQSSRHSTRSNAMDAFSVRSGSWELKEIPDRVLPI